MNAVTIHPDTAAEINPAVWKKYKLGPIEHLWRLVIALVAVHVGTLIVTSLYYLAFETNASATAWWHATVSNGDLRHTIRDVAEGVLGAFLAKAVVWNHFTKGHVKVGFVYGKLKRCHIPETPLAIISALLTFAALFALGYWLLELVHVHSVAAASTGGVWAKTQAIWTDGYVNKILGFVCTLFAVRPLHAMYDNMQGYFEERRAARFLGTGHGKPPFLYPANIKNRFHYIVDNNLVGKDYGRAFSVVLPVLALVGLGLAVYGWYILAYIA